MTRNDELLELAALIEAGQITDAEPLYEEIKNRCYDDINFDELAVKQVLEDIRDIRKTSTRDSRIIEDLMIDPLQTLQELANVYTMTKENVNLTLAKYARKYRWLATLVELRRRMFEKGNANNADGSNGRAARRKHDDQLELVLE